MGSIVCTDLSDDTASSLNAHLKSNAFFGVEKFPKTSLEFTEVKAKKHDHYKITANVTIKGITKSVFFQTKITGNSATANIILDRSEFDVRYGSNSFFSGLGDKLIHDKFMLNVNLVF